MRLLSHPVGNGNEARNRWHSRSQFSRSWSTTQVIAGPTRTLAGLLGRRSDFGTYSVGTARCSQGDESGQRCQVSQGQSVAYASQCLRVASGAHRSNRFQTDAGIPARTGRAGWRLPEQRRGGECGIRVEPPGSNLLTGKPHHRGVDECGEESLVLASAVIFPFRRATFQRNVCQKLSLAGLTGPAANNCSFGYEVVECEGCKDANECILWGGNRFVVCDVALSVNHAAKNDTNTRPRRITQSQAGMLDALTFWTASCDADGGLQRRSHVPSSQEHIADCRQH